MPSFKLIVALCLTTLVTSILVSCKGGKPKDQDMSIDVKYNYQCFRSGTVPDSIEIVMRFVDEKNKGIKDSTLVKRIPAHSGKVNFKKKLAKGDKWKIVKVQRKGGNPVCLYSCEEDSTKYCKAVNNKLTPAEYVSPDSAGSVDVSCECK